MLQTFWSLYRPACAPIAAMPPLRSRALCFLLCGSLLLALTQTSHAIESWWGGGSYQMYSKINADTTAFTTLNQTVNGTAIPLSSPSNIDLNGATGSTIELRIQRIGRGNHSIKTDADSQGRIAITFTITGGTGMANQERRVALVCTP